MSDRSGTRVLGGWQIVGPSHIGGKLRDCWTWTATGPAMGEGGQAATEDRARELAQEAYRRLNPGVSRDE